MDLKVENNHAVELMGGMFKYVTYKAQQVNWIKNEVNEAMVKEFLDFSPTDYVKIWLRNIDNNISPFLRNDLIFLFRNVYGLLDICLELIVKHNIEDPLILLDEIEKVDSFTLVKECYYYYDCELPLDSSDIELKSYLSKTYTEEIGLSFVQIRKHPGEFKAKILNAFTQFYDQFYKPLEEEINRRMKYVLSSHNAMLKKDPIDFINAVGLGDYSKALKEKPETKIFVSLFIDLGFFYFSFKEFFVIFYGQTIENKLNKNAYEGKHIALFKALSDPKRIEIIKLTSKRPWYNKELADYFNITTATLSYHINLLLELNILEFDPSITSRYYYVTKKERLKRLFNSALEDLIE